MILVYYSFPLIPGIEEVNRLRIELQKSELIDIDTCWLETLFILIGEHADPYNHIINGAVVNVRPKKFRIAVWLKVTRFIS